MKNNITITSIVSIDEIKEQLINNFDVKQLVSFVLGLADKSSFEIDYLYQLHKAAEKAVDELVSES